MLRNAKVSQSNTEDFTELHRGKYSRLVSPLKEFERGAQLVVSQSALSKTQKFHRVTQRVSQSFTEKIYTRIVSPLGEFEGVSQLVVSQRAQRKTQRFVEKTLINKLKTLTGFKPLSGLFRKSKT